MSTVKVSKNILLRSYPKSVPMAIRANPEKRFQSCLMRTGLKTWYRLIQIVRLGLAFHPIGIERD